MKLKIAYTADDGREKYVFGDIDDRDFNAKDFSMRYLYPAVETIRVGLFPERFPPHVKKSEAGA